MLPVHHEKIAQFQRFVQQARALPPTRQTVLPTETFSQFIGRAKPLILQPVHEVLEAISGDLQLLDRFLIPQDCDLLGVARLSYAEDAYTELMRWAMDPSVHSQVALACQRAWLDQLGIGEVVDESPALPRTQVYTNNGVPDLIIRFTECLVIVEAKTGSAEHGACGGDLAQTLAYPAAVRACFGLPADYPTEMIFLTPKGIAAENPAAVTATYLGFAVALARAVAANVDALSLPLLSAYSAVITHFATRAVPANCEVRRVIGLTQQNADNELSDAVLLSQVADLLAVYNVLEGD